MKTAQHLISVFIILLIQLGSTSFGYYIKECSDSGTNTISISKRKCLCFHKSKKQKTCCHKPKKEVSRQALSCCDIDHFQNSFDNENSQSQKAEIINSIKPTLNLAQIDFKVIGEPKNILKYAPPDKKSNIYRRVILQSFRI